MKFRTEYIPSRSPLTLNPDQPAVLAGSCFTQNVAERMKACLWDAATPAGTLYNPASIFTALRMLADSEEGLTRFKDSLFNHNGIWNSHFFDSSFSGKVKDDCIKEFQSRQSLFQEKLREGRILILTFGTSICYFLEESGNLVANCHKQPAGLFFRKRLSIEEICRYWGNFHEFITKRYQGLKIILTVSPVRHLKDGFEGNMRSKAVLLLAAEEICKSFEDCFYFPAYEIVNDDLRDYRFYAADLVHPSDSAADYVWEKFKDTFLDSEGLKKLKEGERKYKASLHRPLTGALGKPLSQP